MNIVTVHHAMKAYELGTQGPRGSWPASGGSVLLPIYFRGTRLQFPTERRLGSPSTLLRVIDKQGVQCAPETEAWNEEPSIVCLTK
jgi:hypothetical protein